MIILHSEFDKDSRDFVAAYGEGNTIVTYDECLIQYPTVSAFPSVVIDIPAYSIPEQEIDGEIYPSCTIDACVELYRCPETMQEVLDYISMVNQRAIDNPPIEG